LKRDVPHDYGENLPVAVIHEGQTVPGETLRHYIEIPCDAVAAAAERATRRKTVDE
jgi:hypothetical protein